MSRRKVIAAASAVVVVALAAGLAVVLGTSAHAGVTPSIPRLDTSPASGEASHAHQVQTVDGAAWSMTSVKNAEGQLCAGEKIPGSTADAGQSWSCWDPSTMFDHGPLNYSTGAVLVSAGHGYDVWVDGVASQQVASLVLRLTDCSTVKLPVDSNGLFHHVFGAGEIRQGVGPQELVAYDASGVVIQRGVTKLGAVTLPTPAACTAH